MEKHYAPQSHAGIQASSSCVSTIFGVSETSTWLLHRQPMGRKAANVGDRADFRGHFWNSAHILWGDSSHVFMWNGKCTLGACQRWSKEGHCGELTRFCLMIYGDQIKHFMSTSPLGYRVSFLPLFPPSLPLLFVYSLTCRAQSLVIISTEEMLGTSHYLVIYVSHST